MRIVCAANAQKAGLAAARGIARQLRDAIDTRGGATLALSGGSSAPMLLAELAKQPVDWSNVHVFQTDERIAPAGDAARNLVAIESALLLPQGLPRSHLHAMPVEELDLATAALAYTRLLKRHAGEPPVLDVVHLGLGTDGHTASLFPDDAAINVTERTVVCTGLRVSHRRMTLSLPLISAARHIVWYVIGVEKRAVLARLSAPGWRAPAGRVARQHAVIYADQAALGDRTKLTLVHP